MPNYANGKIYKIVDNTNGNIYIGSTCLSLEIRLSRHISHFRSYELGRSNRITSIDIIINGDYEIVLIENFPCNTNTELHKREQYYQLSMRCINKNIAGRTMREIQITQEYKAYQKEYQKVYQVTNKEAIKKYKKEYDKVYAVTNKGKKREYDKARYIFKKSKKIFTLNE